MWEAFRLVASQIAPTAPNTRARELWDALHVHHEQWWRLRAMELTRYLTPASIGQFLQISMANRTYLRGLAPRANDTCPFPAPPRTPLHHLSPHREM